MKFLIVKKVGKFPLIIFSETIVSFLESEFGLVWCQAKLVSLERLQMEERWTFHFNQLPTWSIFELKTWQQLQQIKWCLQIFFSSHSCWMMIIQQKMRQRISYYILVEWPGFNNWRWTLIYLNDTEIIHPNYLMFSVRMYVLCQVTCISVLVKWAAL